MATALCGGALPRLMRFSGTAKDAAGNPVTGVAGITFALYAEQTGGAPLWTETQNVPAGPGGHYTVLLGAAKSEGLPADLFTAEQAHWVGVSVEGQAEQPRILLVSAPYALKAGDAETLGGLPPSAFLMAAAPSPGGHAPESANASPASASAARPAVGGTGTADYIPVWTDSGDLGNSALFQSGSGSAAKIGINTITPATTLDVEGGGTIRGRLTLPAIGEATATAGQNSQPLALAASAFNNATSNAVTQTFLWQAQPVGNDTPGFSASLNLLFADGKSTPAETGLAIASNGQIAFAAGQTYPGSITGVTAGTDLTGGGATGNITLNLDTTKVPQLATKNTFTANQIVDGKVTATSFSGSGSAVTNVDASELGGLAPSAYAQLAASNTFSGQQVMAGTNTTGVLQVTNTVTSGQGPAIVGTTDSSSAAGIKGIVAATSGTEAGVLGSTSSPDGFGLYGLSPNVGVYGSGGGSSKLGATQGLAGVWGDTGGANEGGFAGVMGTADGNIAGYFANNSQFDITLLAENQYAADDTVTVFEAAGRNFQAGCYIDGAGDLVCTGTVSGAVPAGAQKVSVYATQSTENWLEDAGAGQLLNGSTRVDLDPTFAQTVNTGVAYHVFLTPKGDCKGLYVGGETAQGFEVHEMGGGRSNIAFDYRIMAKRAGFENVRLADVTKKYQVMEQQRKALHERTAQRRAQQAEPNR
jgi:hypothetical protein